MLILKKKILKQQKDIFSLIEIYDYETSQNEYALGLKNQIEEFKNIFEDFHIEFNNGLTYIDYEQAGKFEFTF